MQELVLNQDEILLRSSLNMGLSAWVRGSHIFACGLVCADRDQLYHTKNVVSINDAQYFVKYVGLIAMYAAPEHFGMH